MTTKHTPEWELVESTFPHIFIIKLNGVEVAHSVLTEWKATKLSHKARPLFSQIVRACNSHDDLLAACKYQLSILESIPKQVLTDLEDFKLDEKIDLNRIQSAISAGESGE